MLYLDNGYLNFEYIYNKPYPFTFVCGGRGIGKTFGALDYLLTHEIKFMLLRRTQTQADMISNPDMSPFKALEEFHKKDYITNRIAKSISGVYTEEKGGSPIAYIAALTTISNIRGFDAHDVEVILYDEFIPERHERTIKDEGGALLNAYETVNRNRELKGEMPVKMICLSNSNRLDNPIYEAFDLIKVVKQMEKKCREEFYIDNRGIAVINIQHSPISDKKRETALYKVGNIVFQSMALGNDYNFDASNIGSRNIQEYRPVASISGILIARHKSKGEFYATHHQYGAPKIYGDTDMEILRFRRDFPFLGVSAINNLITYENEVVKIKLNNILGV